MSLVRLADAREVDCHGGKAVQLGAALRGGLPVPDGWALSVELVETVVAGDAAARARVEELFGDAPLAVRSSAVGEDSAEASFAGQHATCLNVRGPAQGVEAIFTVWQSGRTESALGYRRKLGLGGAPRVAVVVQRLVVPDVAGVLFSRNPLDGADERLIEAAWGLGEAVVAGLVTPDRFRLARDGRVIERSAGHKDLAIRPLEGGGTEEVALDEDEAARLCLGDAELTALHSLVARCEAVYGGTQDLEFAFAGGELFLLQRRALTTVLPAG